MDQSRTTIGANGRAAGFRAQIFGSIARQKLFAFASLILLMVFFGFASPAFMQIDNLLGILQSTAVNGVLAIACTFVIITGGIDLSVGTLMTFCAVMAGVFLTYWQLPLWTGVLAALATGAVSGTLSGTFVAKLKLPPFIATLGMMLVNKGLALVVAGDKPIYFNDTDSFSLISQGSVIGDILPSLPVPNSVVILFALAIVASALLNRTALGRYTFALGSNEEAVRLSGVNVDRWKVTIYMLAGAICGVAGLLIASRLNSAQPALGQGYELEAIAAVVIGGGSLAGGQGSIAGAMLGALLMTVIKTGCTHVGLPNWVQEILTGIIIVVAVGIDRFRRR